MTQEQSWNVQLDSCMRENPDMAEALKRIIPKSTLRDYRLGVSNFEKIPESRKQAIYEMTGLDVFKVEGLVKGEDVDVLDILRGEQPREYLNTWLELQKKTKTAFAKECGVDRATLKRYINEISIRSSAVRKIERTLYRYVTSKGPMAEQPENEIQGSVDLANLEISSIIDNPEKYLVPWLESRGTNRNQFAKECGVSHPVIGKYARGQLITGRMRRKIERTIRKYSYKDSGKEQVVEEGLSERVERTTGEESGLVQRFLQLTEAVEGLRHDLVEVSNAGDADKLIAARYNPSLKTRIETIDDALGIVAEELDYFREAPVAEKQALAKQLDKNLFGYVVGILGGIHKGDDSFETILRMFPPPRTIRRNRK